LLKTLATSETYPDHPPCGKNRISFRANMRAQNSIPSNTIKNKLALPNLPLFNHFSKSFSSQNKQQKNQHSKAIEIDQQKLGFSTSEGDFLQQREQNKVGAN
jgi:hypothetical protein